MKILLVANYKNDKQFSMQFFAGMLGKELSVLGCDVKTIRPEPVFGKIKPSRTGIGKWLGYIDKFIVFPYALKKAVAGADVVHICDHSNAFYTKYMLHKPHIVTCHDILAIRSAMGEFEHSRTGWTGVCLQKIILKGLKKAMYIACDSEATEQDVKRIVGSDEKRQSVIYLGLSYQYKPVERQKAFDVLEGLKIERNKKFMLHVGNDSWYKNRSGLLSIFAHITKDDEFREYQLIIAGQGNADGIKDRIETLGLGGKVKVISRYLESPELEALYSAAEGLLFPSFIEGFGWPIIEAQACGCPVFTTAKKPMTELGGDAAVYFDPSDEISAAQIIRRTLSDRKALDAIRAKTSGNLARFDRKRMAEEYFRIYSKVMELSRERGDRSLWKTA